MSITTGALRLRDEGIFSIGDCSKMAKMKMCSRIIINIGTSSSDDKCKKVRLTLIRRKKF